MAHRRLPAGRPRPGRPSWALAYIGEGDNVFKRLLRHNKNEATDFWERTVVKTPPHTTAVDARKAA